MNSPNKEIETSYNVDATRLPDISVFPYADIEQLYLTPTGDNYQYPEISKVEWRIRRVLNFNGLVEFSSTVKIGDKKSGERIEIETSLNSDKNHDPIFPFYKNLAYGIVKKRRYQLGEDLVLDIYDPNLHGVRVTAEKEFKDKPQQTEWIPPEWCVSINNVSNRDMAVPINQDFASNIFDSEYKTGEQIKDELLILSKNKKPLIVTVSGITGSGKSTFANQLAQHIDAAEVPTDQYHIGTIAIKALFGEINYDFIGSYDYPAAGAAALRLASGEEVEIPVYSFTEGERTSETTLIKPTSSKHVVVDGLYASQVFGPDDTYEDVIMRHVKIDTPMYVSAMRRILRETRVNSSEAEREVYFTPQQTLQYLVETALPTYFKQQPNIGYHHIVR